MKQIGVVSAGLGTAVSIKNLIFRIGEDAELVTDSSKLGHYSHIVLPGVGSFDEGSKLILGTGWGEAIRLHAEKGKWLLGVCLGMQLLGKSSEEGSLEGLGLLDFSNKRLRSSELYKVPNSGWEKVEFSSDHGIARNLMGVNRFYFVHSFGVQSSFEHCIATSKHTEDFCSVIGKENILGVQFHPEKSHHYGKTLMKNFLEMK
jgi:glutamine amidotransferase